MQVWQALAALPTMAQGKRREVMNATAIGWMVWWMAAAVMSGLIAFAAVPSCMNDTYYSSGKIIIKCILHDSVKIFLAIWLFLSIGPVVFYSIALLFLT
jgi:hypothetical protein